LPSKLLDRTYRFLEWCRINGWLLTWLGLVIITVALRIMGLA